MARVSRQPTITVAYTGYAFWHEWILVIPDKRGEGVHQYPLGQDVKFIQRVLGMNATYFRNLVCDELNINSGALNMESLKVRRAIAKVIVRELGGAKKILQAHPWDLHAS
jgi:hypothetical protein